MTPAASGYAYGSRRRSAAAEEAQELEEDGWADEARGIFREHMGRRALVDGNARSCGQDGLVAVATTLGVKMSKDAVRAATLPPEGDTPVGTIRAYAADTLGISMRSLKDHAVLGHSPWEQPGGAEHQLLLLEAGVYYTELKITMPKTAPTAAAKARACEDRTSDGLPPRAVLANPTPCVRRLTDTWSCTTPTSAAAMASGASMAPSRTTTARPSCSRRAIAPGAASRSRRPRAGCGARSSRLPPRSRLTTRGYASGCVSRPREQRMRVSGERSAQRAGV